MTAYEAYEKQKQQWSDENLDVEVDAIILGWEDKVEEAIKAGTPGCPVGIFNLKQSYVACDYFSALGYAPNAHQIDPNHWSVGISWVNVPLNARAYEQIKENQIS